MCMSALLTCIIYVPHECLVPAEARWHWIPGTELQMAMNHQLSA